MKDERIKKNYKKKKKRKKSDPQRVPLTLKAPPIICSRRQFQICCFLKNNQLGMIFHENRLLADDSHVILYLIFVENWEKMSQNLSSATVVIGALKLHSL